MAIARPVREEQKRPRRRNGLGQKRKELLRGPIDPVQILHDQDERPPLRGAKEVGLERTEGLAATRQRIHLRNG